MIPFARHLADAYAQVGAYDADIIYMYSDFRTFGRHAADFPDRGAFCRAVVAPLLERDITVVISTFSYTSEGRYDVLSTPTGLGAMNKWILSVPGMKRSEHPLFSYAAVGPQAALVEGIGKSAFGSHSVFTRLRGRKAAFLYVGRPVSMGNTSIHHIEHNCGATYRIHKAFKTQVYRGAEYIGTDYTAFVRRLDVEGRNFYFNFERAAEQLFHAGLVREVGSADELTNISLHGYDQTLDALTDMFYRDQNIFLRRPFAQY